MIHHRLAEDPHHLRHNLRPLKSLRPTRRLLAPAAIIGLLLISAACSKDKGDKEPTVSVQVAPVEKTTIQHVIKTQAILFPRQQAAIVSKITPPVQKFLINPGSPVHKGKVSAYLETRDL